MNLVGVPCFHAPGSENRATNNPPTPPYTPPALKKGPEHAPSHPHLR